VVPTIGDDRVSRIATEANVPRKFLALILADLCEPGFLHSHRGKMGGYCLARPRLISLGEIIPPARDRPSN
jgi:DNA-binding IscR family transcriptional regulator